MFLTPEALIETDRALVARGGFHEFVRLAWSVVEPSIFVDGWHIEEICAHLEAVSRGEIRRLVINQPPGTGKSTLVNVLWPAWEWVERPATKWIFASYDSSLVGTRDGGKVIQLLGSDWFRSRWGDLLPSGKAAASMFQNRAGGFRFATSVAGAVTGRHADIQVADDPIKPRDALGGSTNTKNAIRAVSEWWASTMSTRLADQRTGRRVIVMQRLTHDDLAGEMLATGEYTHLRLPMLYEASDPCKTRWGGDRRTTEGEPLFPERFPLPVVEGLARELGPAGWAAQGQQRPSVAGGGIFRRDWFRFWHVIPGISEPCKCDQCWAAQRDLEGHSGVNPCAVRPNEGQDIQSWDLTFKGSEGTDMVAAQVWRMAGSALYLLDSLNERLSYVATKRAFRDWGAKWPTCYDKLVEDKANGPALESDLKSDIPGITLVAPGGGKEARASAASPMFAEGLVFVPHPALAPWVFDYLKQLEAFPRAAHDDMVDATTQALVRVKAHGLAFSAAMRRIRGEK